MVSGVFAMRAYQRVDVGQNHDRSPFAICLCSSTIRAALLQSRPSVF